METGETAMKMKHNISAPNQILENILCGLEYKTGIKWNKLMLDVVKEMSDISMSILKIRERK